MWYIGAEESEYENRSTREVYGSHDRESSNRLSVTDTKSGLFNNIQYSPASAAPIFHVTTDKVEAPASTRLDLNSNSNYNFLSVNWNSTST